MGKPAQAKTKEPEITDEDLDLGGEDEGEIDDADPADDSNESQEAHGRGQPPPPANPPAPAPTPAGSLLNSAPPPAPTASRGGPATPFGAERPEDALPAVIEKKYADNGQHKTGIAYGGDMRKFLSWLRAKSLSLAVMPPGSAQQFLVEVYRNPLMRNRAITALTLLFEQAQAQGISFLPQTMERTKTGRAAKSADAPAGGPPPNAQPTAPTNTTAQPAVFGAPAVPVPQPPPPKPPPMPKPVTAFPSLGQRIQVSRIADGYQPGIPPGTRIPITTYQKEQIEAAGSMEGFVMQFLRPTHGPFAGELPGTYLFQQLDTSARPLPGAEWTITVGPADTARPYPGMGGMQMPGAAPVFHFQPPVPGMPNMSGMPAASLQAELTARLLEREFERTDREAKDAKEQREALEGKKNKGEISDVLYFALSQQIPQARPVDPVEVARRVREEMDRLQPPAATLPTTPSTLDFGQPKEDPSMGRVMALLEKLLERQMQPPPPPPPQKDPVMAFGEMLALFERAKPPPNPLETQLAALALKGLSEPPKAKSTMELIQEIKLLKEAGNILGGEGGPPSLVEGLVDIVHAVTENAEALGEAIGRIRSGAVSGAFEAAKRKRQEKTQQPAQTQQAQPQRVLPSQAAQEKLVGMCNGIQNGDEDQKIVENLLGVIQQLGNDPDPTGMDRWKRFSQAIVKRYLDAESGQEIQGLVFWFFEQLGAKKLYTSYPKVLERLTQALTDNYSVIHALLTGGKEKSLPTPGIAPTQPAANQTVTTVAAPAQAQAAEPAPQPEPEAQGGEGDEDGDEDGEDEEEQPEQAAG